MTVFFSTTNSKKDFDLVDLLQVLESVFKTNDFEFELINYEYSSVNFDYREVNKDIITFLRRKDDGKLKINYVDFLKFSQFVGQTEDGYFKVLIVPKNISLKISVYDCFFWDIASNNEKAIIELSNHPEIIKFNREIE